MRRTLFILLFALVGVFSINAQEKADANKIVQDRLNNMKANLSLSSTESKTFWSAYEQFLQSEVKCHDTYRTNLSKRGIKACCPKCSESCESLTDEQITYLYDQKFELRKNLLNLETTFYKKAKSILTPKHLQELYKIDEKYKRSFVKNKSSQAKSESTKATPNKPKR